MKRNSKIIVLVFCQAIFGNFQPSFSFIKCTVLYHSSCLLYVQYSCTLPLDSVKRGPKVLGIVCSCVFKFSYDDHIAGC